MNNKTKLTPNPPKYNVLKCDRIDQYKLLAKLMLTFFIK